MKQTAVEWFAKELNNWRIKEFGEDSIIGIPQEVFEKAKAMEKKEKLKHQLFVGKVTDVIGCDKTLDLLRECYNEIR